MSKLTNKEIEQIKGLEMENGLENGLEIPRDAHSVFQFDINETIKDLKNDLERRNYRDFEVWKIDANRYGISELMGGGGGSSELTVGKGKMSIETALGVKYNITEKPEGGSRVTFEGPVNALLDQDLLPKMTYVPYTLSAKFIDSENGKDLTDYMNMNSYGFLRAEKNKKADEWGDKENPQDGYGYHINAKFNNEIDFLPQSNKVDEKENSVVKQNKENLVVEQNVETALYKVRDMISHKSAEALKNISEPAQKATNVVRKNTKDLER